MAEAPKRNRASWAPPLFQDVVEIEAFRWAQPLEAYAGIGSQFGVTFRVAVSARVRVGGARDKGIRDRGEPGQYRLQCPKGTRPYPAAGRNGVSGRLLSSTARLSASIGPAVMATRRTSSLAWPNTNSVSCPPPSEPL
jgi:hypothetical protein